MRDVSMGIDRLQFAAYKPPPRSRILGFGAFSFIEYRWAENQYDRLPALGAGSRTPSGGGDCHARWKCGVTCCEAGDHHDSSRVLWHRRPGRSRLVASLNRPGGNVTGVVTLNIDTGQKRLELGSTTARSGDEVALLRSLKTIAAIGGLACYRET